MPPVRKNVRPSLKDASSSDDDNVVVPPKPKQLFDWDDMELAPGVNLTTSDEESSGLSSHQDDIISETVEWMRNLISVRRAKTKGIEDDRFRASAKGWLQDQHGLLRNGRMPATLKCVLAASGVSREFAKCKDEFMRFEYRGRYWEWSVKLMQLVDYYIDKGNTKVEGVRYQDLSAFVENCRKQKTRGMMSTEREEMLATLGIKWDEEGREEEHLEDEHEDQYGDSSEAEADSNADETWQMPGKLKAGRVKKKPTVKRRGQKRKRAKTTWEVVKEIQRERSPSPAAAFRQLNLREWGEKIFRVREYYRKQKGTSELYDIPNSQMDLKIWMNAEVARSSTGLLADQCSAILKAAELADTESIGELEEECEAWGVGFVQYMDFLLRKPGKFSNELSGFMVKNRQDALYGTLGKQREDLLMSVDHDWMNSKSMRVFLQREKRRFELAVRNRRGSTQRKYDGEYENGDIAEVVLDSGTYEDWGEQRKRSKLASDVTDMLKNMIRGEVAVHVEGRKPSEDQVYAKHWILQADAKAFDAYARNWFKAASSGQS